MPRGHLRKRAEDSWSLVIELERDPATGKRRQKWHTVRGTKRQAEKRLAELLVEADRGQLGSGRKVTVAEYLDRWLKDHAEANTSPKTFTRYRGIVKCNIVPFVGQVPLDRLTPAQIVGWQSNLRSAPRSDKKLGTLSPQTCKHAYVVIHTALEHAVKWGLIPANPAARVDSPRAPRREMATFTADQALAFFVALDAYGTSWQAFFYVVMTAALRLAEVTGLRWEDVDLDRSVLSVRQTIYRLPKMGVIKKASKSNAGRRPVDLDAQAVSLLHRHRNEQDVLRASLGTDWQDNGLVFPGPTGKPIGDKPIRRVFRLACAKAGVPEIRIHDLRHTSATLLLKAGVHPTIVSERLGHSSVALTFNTYTHVIESMQREAADKLGQILRRPETRLDPD